MRSAPRFHRVRACGTALEDRWGHRQALSYDRAVTCYIAGGLGGIFGMALFVAATILQLGVVSAALLVVVFLGCMPLMAVSVVFVVRVSDAIYASYGIPKRAHPKLSLRDMKDVERFDAWVSQHQNTAHLPGEAGHDG